MHICARSTRSTDQAQLAMQRSVQVLALQSKSLATINKPLPNYLNTTHDAEDRDIFVWLVKIISAAQLISLSCEREDKHCFTIIVPRL